MTLVDVPREAWGAVEGVVAVLAGERLPRVGSQVLLQRRFTGAGSAADGAHQVFCGGWQGEGGAGGGGGGSGGAGRSRSGDGGDQDFGRQGRRGEDGAFGLLMG